MALGDTLETGTHLFVRLLEGVTLGALGLGVTLKNTAPLFRVPAHQRHTVGRHDAFSLGLSLMLFELCLQCLVLFRKGLGDLKDFQLHRRGDAAGKELIGKAGDNCIPGGQALNHFDRLLQLGRVTGFL